MRQNFWWMNIILLCFVQLYSCFLAVCPLRLRRLRLSWLLICILSLLPSIEQGWFLSCCHLFCSGRVEPAFKTSSIGLQVLRSVIGGLGMLCVFTGLSITSLAEVTVLLFTVPIFATLFSICFMAEDVGMLWWLFLLAS